MQPINTVNPTIYMAIELSASTWLIAARLPGSEKPHLHRIDGGDTAALFALISSLRARIARRLDPAIGIVCCFEAGRDGFWLHRLLTAHGVANYVLEPTSILVNRRARRAKTDRLDAIGMLRVLAAYLRGDRQGCSMVRVPTPEDEDAKRIHRERANLVQEKLRIENRIEALLFTQGIRKRPSLRSWERDLAVLRTGDGREMPHHLRAELDRLRRRLVMILELIREVEVERDKMVTTKPEHHTSRKIVALCRIRGLGENFAGVLTREVFYRSFDNRRQIASYVGITPMPYQSGSMDRDRRISRAGNPRARSTSLSARKRVGRMVPQARRHLGWTHAADRHCGHGTQAAHRALALCRNGGSSPWCRNPDRELSGRVKEQELSAAILPTAIRGTRPFSSLEAQYLRVSGGSRLAGATPQA